MKVILIFIRYDREIIGKPKVLIQHHRNIIEGEMMEKKLLETRLVRRHSQFPTVCIYCNTQIPPDDLHYVEEGITDTYPFAHRTEILCVVLYQVWGTDSVTRKIAVTPQSDMVFFFPNLFQQGMILAVHRTAGVPEHGLRGRA